MDSRLEECPATAKNLCFDSLIENPDEVHLPTSDTTFQIVRNLASFQHSTLNSYIVLALLQKLVIFFRQRKKERGC